MLLGTGLGTAFDNYIALFPTVVHVTEGKTTGWRNMHIQMIRLPGIEHRCQWFVFDPA
jgi:hypothetical protein